MSSLSVLVTGGTGFVGSAIVEAIQEKHPNWLLTVFDLIQPVTPREKVRYITGDATSTDDVRKAMQAAKPAVVIHAAGLVPPLIGRYDRSFERIVFNVNVEGTKIMLSESKRAGVEAFVWTSSCCCVTDDFRYQYPNIDESWPTSSQSLVYGESKAAAEALVLAASSASFATCALRPSVLFGPDDYQLIPSIHACILKHETPFIIGDGQAMWDVTYVTNVADAHVLAAENLTSSKTAAGHAFFISNNEPITFRDFCLVIWSHFGHYPPFEIRIPEWIATFAGYVAEWTTWLTGNPVTLSSGSVKDACGVRYCNGAKAKRILGYEPRVGIEEGIRISCQVYAKRLEQQQLEQKAAVKT